MCIRDRCGNRCPLDSTAARNFHPHDGYTLNLVLPDNLGQFFTVIDGVQLGTANQRYFPADKIVMEIAVGVGGAVCRNQQGRMIKIRRIDWRQFNLNGPLRCV